MPPSTRAAVPPEGFAVGRLLTCTGQDAVVRTLHLGLVVTDLDRSLAFYGALGYEVVGEVAETPLGHLTMLKLPDDEFVSLELVHRDEPSGGGGETIVGDTRLSHLVVQVASMDEALERLAAAGIATEPPTSPDGSGDFLTAMLSDPDGVRIELVQWAAGHPVGMTAADFAGAGGSGSD
jgi:lactoylglutathione lyase